MRSRRDALFVVLTCLSGACATSARHETPEPPDAEATADAAAANRPRPSADLAAATPIDTAPIDTAPSDGAPADLPSVSPGAKALVLHDMGYRYAMPALIAANEAHLNTLPVDGIAVMVAQTGGRSISWAIMQPQPIGA